MDEYLKSGAGEFELLTKKQAAVLDLLARSLTSTAIAGRLGMSESAVNRHVEILRSRFGGITRGELAQRYRERLAELSRAEAASPSCVDSTKQIIDLADGPHVEERKPQDSPEANLAFRDPIAMAIDAPWMKPEEPRVVPRVLDGANATLTRGAAITIILLGIIASLVLGLAAAQAIAEAVN